MADMLLRTPAETPAAGHQNDLKVRDMLLVVMRSLVDAEDKLEVALIAAAEGAAFQVRCAALDIGKLIGKSGRTARAIRTILSASAAKNGRRYTLDITQN